MKEKVIKFTFSFFLLYNKKVDYHNLQYYVNCDKIIKDWDPKEDFMENKYKKIYMDNVYQFAKEFKKDSAYLINRFLNGYSKDKMRKMMKVYCGWQSNLDFDKQLDWINKSVKSYKPINPKYIDMLKYFALYMSEQVPFNNAVTVWRGCDELEDKAVSGLVATSTKRSTAENFNYGTLLKINIPKGLKAVKYSDIDFEDVEHEVILPPCDYIIKSEKEEVLREGKTRVVEIDVEPRDLLRQFAIAMGNPTNDYVVENGIDDEYKTALAYLSVMLAHRTINNCVSYEKIEGTGLNGSTDIAKRDGIYNTAKNTQTNMHNVFKLMNLNAALPNHLISSMRERVLNESNLPEQITTKQFFDYIKRSRNKRVFYDYENTSEHEKYYLHADHGINHADNVTIFTYYIADKEGYTDDGIRILMEAARYHDIGRTNSWQEGGHGLNGAKKYATEYKKELPTYEQQIIGFLIQAHDLERKEDIQLLAKGIFSYFQNEEIDILYDMANIIREADALDRTRFPIYSEDYLKTEFLMHDSAKELIEVAQTINYREYLQYKNQKDENKRNYEETIYTDGK